jgi:Tol biopolymer transport system component
MIEQVISHYRILRKLGAGGMGEVYLASDLTLGRRVALKLLPPEHTQDEERLRRFKQEAKSASSLNHPNILTIHEVGEADGHHFIATEFVDGQSLREALDRDGPMSADTALPIASQMASALAAAHEAGIVHRDIKPENIMLRRDGYVKVLDFGLAKLTQGVEARDASTSSASVPVRTVSGIVLGTPQYMSPEQATGTSVDARSDIFSFGVVLYEMVTGERAFGAGSQVATVAAILTQEPRPLPATIPSDLAQVILRALEKDPGQRYQTMADVKRALEEVARPDAARRTRRVGERGRWNWAALVVVAAGAGFVAWRVSRSPDATEPLSAVPLTTVPGIARYPSLSPDGDRVAFTWTGATQDNPDVYVQQIGSGDPLRLTSDPGNDFNPVWSPDGRWIAFLRSQSEAGHSEVRLVPPLGGPDRKLAEIRVRSGLLVAPPYLTWCPDGSCLIATDSPAEGTPDALFVISRETGAKRQLTHPAAPALGDVSPTVSSDGRRLVFRRTAGLFVGELYELALGRSTTAVGDARRLTPATLNAEYPTWLPNDQDILFSARGSLWRLDVAGHGSPARMPYVGEYGIMPAVSRAQSGRPSHLVYVRSLDDENIWRLVTPAPGATPTSAPAVAIASTRLEGMPQLSPNARRVTFASDRSGNWEIWVSDQNGANAIALTSMEAVATGYPHWSPDGDHIAFHSNEAGQWDVYIVSVAGEKPRRLTDHPAADDFPSFSRDGKWVYFSSDRAGGQQQSIWKVAVTGGDAKQVTTRAAYAPQESPDGAHIYYVETIDRPSALWRMPVAGGAAERVLDGVYLANFVVLRSGIYYIDRPAGGMGIHYIDLPSGATRLQYFNFTTRQSTTVVPNLGKVDVPFTVSADGRTILYPRMDASVNDLMVVTNFR